MSATTPPAFAPWRNRFEVIQADVTSEEQIRGCCRACEAVLHLAALDREEAAIDPARAIEVSGAGTRNLLAEAIAEGVTRVVYFSTVHVYGTPLAESVDEESSACPVDDYSIAHYLGELYCERARVRHDVAVTRLRIANGYGAPVHRSVRCWSLVLHDLCRAALIRGEIVVRSDGRQRRDFVPLGDIGQAVELVLTTPPAGVLHSVYNVGSGVLQSVNQVAARVARVYHEIYGRAVPIVHKSPPGSAGRARATTLDLTRITELGFRPSPATAMDAEIRRIFAVLESP